MERAELPQLHHHPLVPFNRFAFSECEACCKYLGEVNIYGGYRCNELGCLDAVFHKECFKPLKEINHSIHPDHPLKLIIPTLPLQDSHQHRCFCGDSFEVGYCCSICHFKLELKCARRPEPLVTPENSYGHEHPLKLVCKSEGIQKICKTCGEDVCLDISHYRCQEWEEFVIHMDCLDCFQEAYHTCHPQHPLKSFRGQVPDYADKKCLLCENEFDQRLHQLHHCDVCNFSICRECIRDPPPLDVECLKTHEHRLHLLPRLIEFVCNACGTTGSRSPYLCLQCNYMIHRECIDLPGVININRHHHRISYTPRVGFGEWKCRVCRKKVDGFYGAYTCSKCPSFAAHARCATREDVWDMVELEGTPEEDEDEVAPYIENNDNTIRHFCHDHHNLQFNKDGMILPEGTLCNACVFQIGAGPFYICNHHQCDFILHEKYANLPRKKRHVLNNLPFTLYADSPFTFKCELCDQNSTGFRYDSGRDVTLDVRCALIFDSIEHTSHPHPLYYTPNCNQCSRCGHEKCQIFSCDECDDYKLDGKCAMLPKKVMKIRYDDHPLFLSYGDMNVDEIYWCEACETKLDPKKGFYTCNDCGVVLHISCLFGDFSYIMPASFVSLFFDFKIVHIMRASMEDSDEEVVSNNSISRHLCAVCNSRCKLPSVLEVSKGEDAVYICSLKCRYQFGQ